MPTVLFDLTVLATATRMYGLGRYVASVARGIAGLSQRDVTLRFVERIGFNGKAHITDDAPAAIERLLRRPKPENTYSWAYRSRLGMAQAMRHAGAELLHLGHPGATPLFWLPGKKVVTCHDLIPLRYPRHYLGWTEGWAPGRRWLDTRRYHSADHVIAISEATKNDLTRLLAVPAERVTVVPNGIDLERWTPDPDEGDDALRARLGVGERPYVLYVGGGDWRKNTEGMCAALARARESVPDLQLLWAGRLLPSHTTRAREAARRHGVSNALSLLGFVDDAALHALYRGALAAVFVSHAEGFGYPVVEAMALGCPIITSDRSSMVEIAKGHTLTVAPHDHAAIAQAMVRLATDSALVEQLRSAGLKRARDYGLERTAQETMAVYRRMLERRS